MKIKIAPSILSADFSRLGEEIQAVEAAGADLIHIDVMDGQFVPNLTVGSIVVKAARKVTRLPLDVHLMTLTPDALIPDYVKAGADIITVHWEACPHLHRTLQGIKRLGVKAGVSINPATPVSSITDIVDEIDLLLVMSVNPGFGGQEFIPKTINKIKMARKMLSQGKSQSASQPLLEVDGGINTKNARQIAAAGADIFVAGSAIFNTGDYKKAIRDLRNEKPVVRVKG